MNPAVWLTMAAGMGLFLYGMKAMSESIEKVAGAKLRTILERLTSNRFMGLLVGVFFTAVIQSSSACTSMVVSFVNSGLMTLSQAAGVIFGANIGTTVTSQLVSFNLSAYAPIFLLFGALAMMFGKEQTMLVKLGEVVAGFGILFLGLRNMSDAMADLKNAELLVNALSSFSHPLLALIVGAAVTAIVQSSSVTVSIILLLANQGLLPLRICLFMILGCNIGACSTALLTSLSGKKEAKRAALIHLLFNVLGTLLIGAALFVAVEPIVEGLLALSGNNAGRVVANAHTLFKIVQVVLLLPFTGLIVRLTYLLVPGEDEKIGYRESFRLQFIGETDVFHPATALVDAIKEIDRMASLASENLNRSMNALVTLDHEDIDEVYRVEENIDYLSHAITDYLIGINQSTLPGEDRQRIAGLFHAVNDIERIGDHAENFADAAKRREEKGLAFTKEALHELGGMLDMVNEMLRYAVETFVSSSDRYLQRLEALEDQVDEKERSIQRLQVERLTSGESAADGIEAGILLTDVVSGLERIGDHAMNIAYAVLDIEKV